MINVNLNNKQQIDTRLKEIGLRVNMLPIPTSIINTTLFNWGHTTQGVENEHLLLMVCSCNHVNHGEGASF